MSKKYKNKSLSERVSENLNPHLNDSDNTSEDEETPKVTHFDEDDYNLGQDESIKSLSEIRKRNVKLLSEQSNKYSGVIASRKNYDMSDIDDDDSQTSAPEDSEIFKNDPNDSENDNSKEEDSDADQISNEVADYSTNEDEEPGDTELVSAKNNKLETEKGICVQNQLSIWEKLLEIRIHSQKMLNKANSLPDPIDFNKLSSNKEFKDTTQDVKKNAEILLEKLIETQVTLANQFSEIKKLGLSARKRTNSRSSGEGSDYSSKKFAPAIEENFEKFRPYRNTVLLKWEDRTKLLAPSSGKQRKQLTEEFDIVKKVDNILMKRDEHIAKSQKLKGTYKLFGQNETNDSADGKADEIEVSSPHIYDDTDFYHSQLRELIEFKSNVSSDAFDVTKQFAELQKLRQKMKKKVDTRASKGRKIRYVVHNKLVNFMAPNDTTDWTDESKNELYRSLFVT
ncbi:protein Aatf [Episyrphus balteatus]|uniref:protein Aatf n=1 Tax=Episyrphus balteatus TaxID=286459 RepID=UPI002485D534|nr:protein Aatf [Episyrphus balteatus]